MHFIYYICVTLIIIICFPRDAALQNFVNVNLLETFCNISAILYPDYVNRIVYLSESQS